MDFRFYTIIAFVLALSVPPSYSFAGNTPTAAMLKIAEIMHRLKHFPSPVGKSTLQSLAGQSSTTTNEKIIIQAMVNLQHEVSSADRGKLTSLVKNSNSNNERSVATILLNLDHRPTKQDKAILKKILGK